MVVVVEEDDDVVCSKIRIIVKHLPAKLALTFSSFCPSLTHALQRSPHCRRLRRLPRQRRRRRCRASQALSTAHTPF